MKNLDYEEGQGIAKHADSPNFGPEIFCVSLLSNCVMNFRKKDAEKIGDVSPSLPFSLISKMFSLKRTRL
jgi:hypothetical protein